MKHIKIYEDFGFDKPTIHEDNDLFDEIVRQFGRDIDWREDKDYWRRNVDSRKDGFHIRWKHEEPLKLQEFNFDGKPKLTEYYFEIEKVSGDIKNILDNRVQDKYNCWLENSNYLDVSEEKIKDLFDSLESLYKKDSKDIKKLYRDERKIAAFAALRKREDEIIDKEAKKYNI